MKIKKLLLLFVIFAVTSVNAKTYSVKELISINKEATVETDNFIYKDFYYSNEANKDDYYYNHYLMFKSIKNKTNEEKPVSISVGLFDKNKTNIGTLNYCSTNDSNKVISGLVLKGGEEKGYIIDINSSTLGEDYVIDDVQYIAVLSDNIKCRISSQNMFFGKKIDQIDVSKIDDGNNKNGTIIQIGLVVGIIVVALIIYKFLFKHSKRSFRDEEDII